MNIQHLYIYIIGRRIVCSMLKEALTLKLRRFWKESCYARTSNLTKLYSSILHISSKTGECLWFISKIRYYYGHCNIVYFFPHSQLEKLCCTAQVDIADSDQLYFLMSGLTDFSFFENSANFLVHTLTSLWYIYIIYVQSCHYIVLCRIYIFQCFF